MILTIAIFRQQEVQGAFGLFGRVVRRGVIFALTRLGLLDLLNPLCVVVC